MHFADFIDSAPKTISSFSHVFSSKIMIIPTTILCAFKDLNYTVLQ